MRIAFSVPGDPVGKERPRVVKAAGKNDWVLDLAEGKKPKAMAYTPKKTKDYGQLVQTYWMINAGCKKYPDHKKIYMGIRAFFRNDTRPDLNNVERLVADALEKTKAGFIAYPNDKYIVCSFKDYFYDKVNPRLEIILDDEKMITAEDFE